MSGKGQESPSTAYDTLWEDRDTECDSPSFEPLDHEWLSIKAEKIPNPLPPSLDSAQSISERLAIVRKLSIDGTLRLTTLAEICFTRTPSGSRSTREIHCWETTNGNSKALSRSTSCLWEVLLSYDSARDMEGQAYELYLLLREHFK